MRLDQLKDRQRVRERDVAELGRLHAHQHQVLRRDGAPLI
jgi:hypothetical protein